MDPTTTEQQCNNIWDNLVMTSGYGNSTRCQEMTL